MWRNIADRNRIFSQRFLLAGGVGILVLAVVLTSAGFYLRYIVREAALPQPRGVDGKIVVPVINPLGPESIHLFPTPKRLRRAPKMSVESLERPDDVDIRVQNWDAALTLAHMSSEVYDDTRIRFAQDTLKFDRAVAVDNGDRHSLVCSNSTVLVVAFRGTQTWTDVLLDLGLVPIGLGVDQGCLAHAGFYLACNSLYDNLIQEIDNQDGRNKKIIVTGHSLGGAMAVLFSYRAEVNDGLKIKSIVTFGQPLVANERFASSLLYRFRARHTRFVHRDDIVSRVARPYYHSGTRILLEDEKYPQFWKPEILVQATPEGIRTNQPDPLIDPKVASLSEGQLKDVRDYLQADETLSEVPLAANRTRRHSRHKNNERDRLPVVGATTKSSGFEWIRRAAEDHNMPNYIRCIEAQEVELNE